MGSLIRVSNQLHSNPKRVNVRVRQGSVLSPLLFYIVLEVIVQQSMTTTKALYKEETK